MRFPRALRPLLFFVGWGFLLFPASPAEALTLGEALQRIASHPALIVQSLEVQAARVSSRDAGRRGPDVVAFEAENWSGSERGFSQAESTLSFSRPLLDKVRVQAVRRQAQVGIRQTESVLERRRWEISSAVQQSFHQVLLRQGELEVARDACELAAQLLAAATGRVEAGSAPESETHKADLELQRAKAEADRLAGQVAQARLALRRDLGGRLSSDESLVGSLPAEIHLPDPKVLEKNLFAIHPDLLANTQAREEVEARRQVLRADRRPSWSVTGGVRDFRDDGKWALVMGLEAELPHRQATSGQEQALLLEVARLDQERQRLRTELSNRLEEIAEAVRTNSRAVTEFGTRILPATRGLHEMAMEGYRLGKTGQLNVLEARKAELDSRREYWRALEDLYAALDELERLCGLCLVGEAH